MKLDRMGNWTSIFLLVGLFVGIIGAMVFSFELLSVLEGSPLNENEIILAIVLIASGCIIEKMVFSSR